MKTDDEMKNKYPWNFWWKRRTIWISKMIPIGVSVLDLGGGFCHLERFLKKCRYVSIDIDKWTKETVVADFNNGEFPNLGEFDYIICAGILEYIDKPGEFLKSIRKYGKIMILSYLSSRDKEKHGTETMDMQRLKSVISESGWEMLAAGSIWRYHKIFYCSKKE